MAQALGQGEIGRGVVAGVSILLLAIVLDRITQAMGAAPKTSRGPVGQLGFGRWPRIRALVRARRRSAPGDREEGEMRRHGTGSLSDLPHCSQRHAATSRRSRKRVVVAPPRHRQRRAVRRRHDRPGGEPWIGAKANAAVAQVLMEQQMGCTVELEDPIAEKAQFPAMADGDVDATLEVWPSGHADDYAQFIEEAGTVVDGGLLGITGNIGWFVPSYVIDEYPSTRPGRASRTTPIFSTADTGDKGRFLGADTTYSIFDEQIIAALDLDLEVIYSGSEDASLSALDTAVQNQDPILMYWWTPQANTKYDLVEVELPAFDDQCADIALNDPEAVGYDCDYADDVLYKAFSAQLEEKDRQHSSSCRTSSGPRGSERRPRDPGRSGARGGRAGGGREPGRLARPGCRRPDRAFEDDAGAALGAALGRWGCRHERARPDVDRRRVDRREGARDVRGAQPVDRRGDRHRARGHPGRRAARDRRGEPPRARWAAPRRSTGRRR